MCQLFCKDYGHVCNASVDQTENFRSISWQTTYRPAIWTALQQGTSEEEIRSCTLFIVNVSPSETGQNDQTAASFSRSTERYAVSRYAKIYWFFFFSYSLTSAMLPAFRSTHGGMLQWIITVLEPVCTMCAGFTTRDDARWPTQT